MFQANVIQGDALEFNSIIYPQQNQNVFNYIKESISQIPQTILSAGQDLFNRAVTTFNNYYSDSNSLRARNAMLATNNNYFFNSILPLMTVESIQTANPNMQRWIMAEPNIRNLYHDQLCDGYSNTYVDMFPGTIKDNHYDYRRVMDGVVIGEQEPELIAKFYIDDLFEGDRDLNHHEKVDILSTWDIINMCMNNSDIDPTSLFNDKIG